MAPLELVERKLNSNNVMSLTREKKEKREKANKNISVKTHIHIRWKKRVLRGSLPSPPVNIHDHKRTELNQKKL